MSDKKEKQVSFRLSFEDFAQTQAGADHEELSVADFSRKLHRAALVLYRQFGSLRELRDFADRSSDVPGKSSKKRGKEHG